MKVYLIRHGETTGDLEGRYGGNYDNHLTILGQEQLRETAKKLAGKNIEIIFASNLMRATESGEIIKAEINSPLEIFDGIQERNYGILVGLTKKEALEKYPNAVESHKNPENTDPDGESLVDFQNRTLAAFRTIFAQNYSTIAIVSHGGPIKQLLKHLSMPLPPKIGDGEIIELSV